MVDIELRYHGVLRGAIWEDDKVFFHGPYYVEMSIDEAMKMEDFKILDDKMSDVKD